ncbi:MAG: hypothetical protein U5K31_11985 [Balneolaceae bacterium]|nr:hypothetical protein [Balneolaceae bacterium]
MDGIDSYPMELTPISESELGQRTAEFRELSDGQICTGLNRYGYTADQGECHRAEGADSSITLDEAIAILRSELPKYHEFTNLQSEGDIHIRDYSGRADVPDSEWKFQLGRQIVNGIPIRFTRIDIWLSAEGIYRIDGHWYPNVVVPDRFAVNRSQARNSVVGHTFKYRDWTGGAAFNIGPDDLPPPDSLETVVFPHRVGDTIQLRLTWRIPFGEEFTWLNLYVDTMDGQILDENMLVNF